MHEIKRPIYAADLIVFSHEGMTDFNIGAFDEVSYKYRKSSPYDNFMILLIKRLYDPFKDCWALPGGHVEENEPSRDAARREGQEETSIDFSEVDLWPVGIFDEPGRDPRGWAVSAAYMTVVDPSLKAKAKGGDDAKEAEWFRLDNLPTLAFDHMKIVQTAMAKFS